MDVVLAVAALMGGLVLLEWGAERFTRAIGGLARRLRASEGVVGLLTAGGEWEELVVVVLALADGHPALAVGNVIGSCLANLIGSMPLGLLGKRPLVLDRSARVYGLVMLGVTVLASLFAFGGRITQLEGGVLVAVFVLYVASVLGVIHRGWLRPPDDDDDDDEAEALAEGSALRPLAALPGGAGLAVPPSVAHVDVPLLLAITLLITLLFRRSSLHRRIGVVLLILYVTYV